jgi:enoyl-CoA hydratase/carnithine racemase
MKTGVAEMAESRVEIDTGTGELLCEIHDRVAVITLNRPEARNALSDHLTPALRRMIKQCGDDPGVGALLITGAGTAFCAGGDVKGMGSNSNKAEMAFEERVADLRTKQRTLTGALVAVRKPTIAALPGPAAGAGMALALACDIRIAGESAIMSTGYARIGLTGDYGIAWMLTRLVGTSRARELMFCPSGSTLAVARRWVSSTAWCLTPNCTRLLLRSQDRWRRGRRSRWPTSRKTSTMP